jgi:hypothetical protein
MGIPLYAIADKYREILSGVERHDIGVEDPESLKQCIQDSLSALNLDDLDGLFIEKALAVACYTREIEAEANAVKQTEDALKSRRKSLEIRAEWLRDYLLVQMQKTNRSELKDNQIMVKLRKCPSRLRVINEDEIPDEFKKLETVTHIFKQDMLSKLRSGEISSIPGVEMETGFTLNIR